MSYLVIYSFNSNSSVAMSYCRTLSCVIIFRKKNPQFKVLEVCEYNTPPCRTPKQKEISDQFYAKFQLKLKHYKNQIIK